MKYKIDHDLHIHSHISSCSNDPEQNNERILRYAEENGLTTICLTDHFWDEGVEGASGWYAPQNFERISKAKPLPRTDKVRFLFGCETELNRSLTVGVSREKYDCFDFIIIPTTHFHMKGYTLTEEELVSHETRAVAWMRRLDAVLNMDLPFHKVGIAHLTCGLIAPTREEYLATLDAVPTEEMERLFAKASAVGVGIELNSSDMSFKDEETDTVLRPYRIAKKQGCKFYLGSDAHHPNTLDRARSTFERAVELLELSEDDKLPI